MDHPEDYVKRVLKVLIYIEDHIEEELSMDELAKVACHSPFHYTGLHGVCDRIFLRWPPESKETFDDGRPVFCELFNLEYVHVEESKLITKIYIPLS